MSNPKKRRVSAGIAHVGINHVAINLCDMKGPHGLSFKDWLVAPSPTGTGQHSSNIRLIDIDLAVSKYVQKQHIERFGIIMLLVELVDYYEPIRNHLHNCGNLFNKIVISWFIHVYTSC
jgi:hypothetical protein